jgi:putative transposase
VTAHQAVHPVAALCRTLGVSPSGYYAWSKRPLSPRARANVELSAMIAGIHRESRGTYGAPRVHAELAAQGIHIGRKRVARLMRAAQLQGVSRRKFRTTIRDEAARPAPDLVDRQFTTAGPDRLWVADITYISTGAGFLFLAVVLDAWSRRVIGWAMETHLRTELVLAARHGAGSAPPDRGDSSLRPRLPVHVSRLRPPVSCCRGAAVDGQRR